MTNIYVSAIDGMSNFTSADITAVETAFLAGEGVAGLTSTDLLPEAQASPNMTVKVNKGTCYVLRDAHVEHDGTQKYWQIVIDGTVDVAITTADPSNPRIDLICVKVDTGATPNANAANVGSIVAVAGTASGSPSRPAVPNNHLEIGQVYVGASVTTITAADITDTRTFIRPTDSMLRSPASVRTDYLINGAMQVWQRGTTIDATGSKNNDDKYVIDQFILLSDGNDIVDVSRDTSVPTGISKYSAKFAVQTANKRFGILQILKGINCADLLNGKTSLSFYAKTNGAEVKNLRAFVLSWSGTEDSPTSDCISSWGSAGSDPTFAASWTKENSGKLHPLSSSWQRFKIENIDVDTVGMTNVAVFIMVDDDDCSVNDDLYITGIQLNEGPVAVDYMPITYDVDLKRARMFYETSWKEGASQENSAMCHALNINGYIEARCTVRKHRKIAQADVSIYDGTTLNQIRDTNTGGTVTSITFNGIGIASDAYISLYSLSKFTANTAYDYNWIVDCTL